MTPEIRAEWIRAGVYRYGKSEMQVKSGAIVAAVAALLFSAGASRAEDLVFTLKNGTNSVLTAFYTSPVGTDDWEEDVFGKDVLGSGESVKITVKDGRDVCDYDMRFEFDEASNLDTLEAQQNLCELSAYTITE